DVARLAGEPDVAGAVEHDRVRVAAGGRTGLDDLAGGRVEVADHALGVAGVTDLAGGIDEETVRARALGKVPLVELLRFGVEAGDAVGEHHRDVDVAVGAGSRGGRGSGRRSRPLG